MFSRPCKSKKVATRLPVVLFADATPARTSLEQVSYGADRIPETKELGHRSHLSVQCLGARRFRCKCRSSLRSRSSTRRLQILRLLRPCEAGVAAKLRWGLRACIIGRITPLKPLCTRMKLCALGYQISNQKCPIKTLKPEHI